MYGHRPRLEQIRSRKVSSQTHRREPAAQCVLVDDTDMDVDVQPQPNRAMHITTPSAPPASSQAASVETDVQMSDESVDSKCSTVPGSPPKKWQHRTRWVTCREMARRAVEWSSLPKGFSKGQNVAKQNGGSENEALNALLILSNDS